MPSKTLSALAILGTSSIVNAFWRMECRGRSGLARIDPIVDPGEISSHAHTIQGSSGFGLSATYSDLTEGNCTSCAVNEDKSAYWTPALYFLDDDTQEFTLVPQVGGMLAYYLPRGDNVTAFPDGFQMIAGNNFRRNFTVGNPYVPDPPQSSWAALKQTSQSDLQQRATGFNCLDYSAAAEPSLYRHYLPNKTFTDANCPDGLRFELMFPSCWNGETTSPDHSSHVAYPDLVGNGNCPDGYPLRLVTLFFETIWDTADASFQGKSGSWVISNGDSTGFGYHGDFMTGWDQSFLQEAIDTCTNESGEISDCDLFVSNGPLQTDEQQGECLFEMPSILASEDDAAVAKTLPGNVQIQNGPEPATDGGSPVSSVISAVSSILGGVTGGATTTTSSSSAVATPTPSTSTTPSGGAFIQSATSATGSVKALEVPSSTSTTPSPTTTPAPEVTSVPGVDYVVVSTQTIAPTAGGMVEEIVWEAPVVYVTEDVVTTVTGTPQRRHEQHALRHRHGHRRGF
ncbi:hypothetical protein F5Y16DRAFT_367307 [Xylariaceae sp. FL0255]|nr:hypothetical protein F5Y16DRAFT_367307 [Xylariaceae sp. FL0255]